MAHSEGNGQRSRSVTWWIHSGGRNREPWSEGDIVATDQEYQNALDKADARGWEALNKVEQELVKKLMNETSQRGNRARRLFG